jgi:hypothetical protein
MKTLLSVTPARAARVLRGKWFSTEAISVTGYGIASPTRRLRLGAWMTGYVLGFRYSQPAPGPL